MRYPWHLASWAMLLAMPALAQSTEPQPDKPKRVCRTQPVTGSRIAASTCHTSEEWAAIDAARERQASDLINGITSRAAQSAVPGQDAGSQMGLSPR